MVQGGRKSVERISRNYVLNIGRVGGLNATMLFVMGELRAQSIADSKFGVTVCDVTMMQFIHLGDFRRRILIGDVVSARSAKFPQGGPSREKPNLARTTGRRGTRRT